MGMANLILPDGFAPTGLTVSARIYAGAALAATVAMAEQPAGSGRYVATWNAAAASTAYDWTAVDAGGVKYGAGPFLTDADGNEVTLARLDEPVSAPKTLTGAERTATADAARDAVEAGGGLLDQVSDAVNSVGVNVNAN
ncbi:MAG TPA: hypothetical protein VK324_13830, partial [Tepidisphaeraceae bacterium]|nr:hypothetical protein [Tepidisphaeraceae bacterium]